MRLYLNDWLTNVGVLGVYRILSRSEEFGSITKSMDYIEFDDSAFDNFGEKYFEYFISTYEKFTSWYRITSFLGYIENFDKNDVDEKKLEYINKQIEYTKTKIKSASYKSGYEAIENKSVDLLNEEKKLKKVTKKKKEIIEEIVPKIEEQLEILKGVIDYLSKDEVRRVIAAKNVIYDEIALFLKDVSFLNKTASKKSMYPEYDKYFLNNLKEYIVSDKEEFKYSCFSCGDKISKLSKPHSYDLTWINKMGVDMSRKTSHFWNFNADTFICPVCNIIYSCIPAGFNVLKGKGLFINDNSSMDRLIRVNNLSIQDKDNMETLESESYYRILEAMESDKVKNIHREVDNIQLVKLDSDNDSRPYTFNVLSREMLKIIKDHSKNMKKLVSVTVKFGPKDFRNIHKEVLKRLYDGRNQFDLIHQLLILNLNGDFKRIGNINHILKINSDFIGMGSIREGEKKMAGGSVTYTQDLGYKLKLSYKKRGAENKISGLTYRMLNALKTKNVDRFIENIIKAYMYMGEPIPTIFMDALKDKDKFSTIGYSFILGMQGESSRMDYIKEGKKDEK